MTRRQVKARKWWRNQDAWFYLRRPKPEPMIGAVLGFAVVLLLSGFSSILQSKSFLYPLQLMATCLLDPDTAFSSSGTVVGALLLFFSSVVYSNLYHTIARTSNGPIRHLLFAPILSMGIFVLLNLTLIPVTAPALSAQMNANIVGWLLIAAVYGWGIAFPWWGRPAQPRQQSREYQDAA